MAVAATANRGKTENLKPFKKGQSGNPSGRPKRYAGVVELARQHTETAITALVQVCESGKPAERVMAATALLERGWGKPAQPIEPNVPAGTNVGVMNVLIADPDARRALDHLAASMAGLASSNGGEVVEGRLASG